MRRRDKYDYSEYPTDNKKGANAAIVAAVIVAALVQIVAYLSEGLQTFWGILFPVLNIALIKPILNTEASNWAFVFASLYFAIASVFYSVIVFNIWGDGFWDFTYLINALYCVVITIVCIKKARG